MLTLRRLFPKCFLDLKGDKCEYVSKICHLCEVPEKTYPQHATVAFTVQLNNTATGNVTMHSKFLLLCFWAYVSCQVTQVQRLTTKKCRCKRVLFCKWGNGCDTSHSRTYRLWVWLYKRATVKLACKRTCSWWWTLVRMGGHLSINTWV